MDFKVIKFNITKKKYKLITMSIIRFVLLLNLISIILAITKNNNIRLRNFGLRLIVFKEKKVHKLLNAFNYNLKKYQDKAIVYIADCINSYNELSEDDRLLIETVISLCY
jgi:hypothetical protein